METLNQILYLIYMFIASLCVSIFRLFEAVIYILGSLAILVSPFILLIIVLILSATAIAFGFIAKKTYMKTRNAYLSGNYDDVISNGKKITKWYHVVSKIIPISDARRTIDDLNGMLAISFLSKNDYENFSKHINAVKHNNEFKTSWLCIYYLLQDDIESANNHYTAFPVTNENKMMYDYLNALFLYKQGEIEKAKEIIDEVYPNLRVKFAKDIVNNLFSDSTT